MAGLTVDLLQQGLEKIAAGLAGDADMLNAADGQLGDGDIGITLARGSQAMVDEAGALPGDVGMALFKYAKAMTKVSGSSFGTLLAIGLMRAAKDVKGRDAVAWCDLAGLIEAGTSEMMVRGKGAYGDKTVLDGLSAVAAAINGLDDGAAVLAAADRAAQGALDTFRGQACKLGRARMFGDKSVGLDDPGMLALARIIAALKA